MGGEEILGYRYRLVDQIGQGGMGVVWRAFDEVLDRQVAVKVLASRFAEDAESRQRVLAEARAAARLTHPHIAAVYDYGESVTDAGNRVPFVVMELLQGRSLHNRLKRGPLPVESALRCCAEIASALASAHAHGVVHRDVKPGNVMLTPAGAKVVDFGLAAVAGKHDQEEDGGELRGTPEYVAPERLFGEAVLPAADVYALGVILYRLLAGRLPWAANSNVEMLEAHAFLEPAPLPMVPGLPPIVRGLVHRCLLKKPNQRPDSHEVAVTLAYAAGVQVPLDRPAEDDLDEPAGSEPSAGEAESGSLGGSSRGRIALRPDPLSLPPATGPAGEPYVARLARHLDGSLDHVALRRQASVLLRGAVDFDLAIWAVLDPTTLMWASCVVDGGPHDDQFERELFANEYGQEDVLRIVDLAEGARVGTLGASTQGDPSSSWRFRHLLKPRGLVDELRLSCYDHEGTWGTLLLYRAGGRFTDADIAQLAPASRPLGVALHRSLVRGDPPAEAPPGAGEAAPPEETLPDPPEEPPAPRWLGLPIPRRARRGRPSAQPAPAPEPEPPARHQPPLAGSLTLSPDGRLFDMTEDARHLLDTTELARMGAAVTRGRVSGLLDPSGAHHDGRWLAFHAVPRETALAVTVQRIRPHQVSDFVIRALGLEPWQGRLLGAVARGRNTRQIAQDLGMSAYAVQDGMMSLFTAFGVSGRVELVKALFFDHYVPLHAADVRVPPAA
ncbi:Serine/threonine protein kinase [Micromonospora rhizosphaerae]|uniref:non-specific serine/threonine protein kinase n=1 Tax=Micromonospora rhizosphaerae TaxID=568872 RepID=A0A1C6REC4_9ACTN|nr:protein kinase [Micromonospora rhizosphaerae]SCL15500.1 Serine/threonine protein kinase [Micromonospora rhizosphaerae]